MIENLTAGACWTESMHGAGPPTAQRIMIGRRVRLERKIAQVKALLDIGQENSKAIS